MKQYESKYYTIYNNGQAEAIAEKFNEMLNEKASDGWEVLSMTNTVERLSAPEHIDGSTYTHRFQAFVVWEKKISVSKKKQK